MPPFGEADLLDDPIDLFGGWYELAPGEVPLADAVCLATVDPAGMPDARMVLLKGVDRRGFRFFTNEGSAKGRQLAAHPAAALVFYWRELDRQVRVRGQGRAPRVLRVRRVLRDPPAGEHDRRLGQPAERAAGGPRRAGRASSPRSRSDTPDGEVPRPPHWGGYLVVPAAIEFWQGQVGRLHDRFRYERADEAAPWRKGRLAP